MSTKTAERLVAAKRPAPARAERDGLGLPGLAEALEVYQRLTQGGGVRPRPAGRRPPAGLSG